MNLKMIRHFLIPLFILATAIPPGDASWAGPVESFPFCTAKWLFVDQGGETQNGTITVGASPSIHVNIDPSHKLAELYPTGLAYVGEGTPFNPAAFPHGLPARLTKCSSKRVEDSQVTVLVKSTCVAHGTDWTECIALGKDILAPAAGTYKYDVSCEAIDNLEGVEKTRTFSCGQLSLTVKAAEASESEGGVESVGGGASSGGPAPVGCSLIRE